MKNIINDRLNNALEYHPDRVAFATSQVSYTYRELAHLVPRIATKLQSEGISSGSRVGISHSPGTDYLLSWSLLWLGAASCSIPKDLRFGNNGVGLDWLIASGPASEFTEVLNLGNQTSTLTLDRLWLMEAEAMSEPISALDLDKSATARLSLTSGSTGEPICESLAFEEFMKFSEGNSSALPRPVIGTSLKSSSREGFEVLFESFELGASLHLIDLDSELSMLSVPDLAPEQIIGTFEQLGRLLDRLGRTVDQLWSLKTVVILGTGVSAQQQEQLKEGFGSGLELKPRTTFEWVALDE